MSIRLTEDLDARLTKCAEEIRLSRHAMAEAAIASAVEAIEANDYKLVLPLEFMPKHVPVSVEKSEAPTVKAGPATAAVYTFPTPPVSKVAEDPAQYGSSKS